MSISCKREDILNKLKSLGIEVDAEVNSKIAGWKEIHEGKITTDNSSIPVYVLYIGASIWNILYYKSL